MKKIFGLVFLISACFGLDAKAKELGFLERTHVGALNDVVINAPTSLQVQKEIEYFACRSLTIEKDTQLEFVAAFGISNASAVIKAETDVLVNGKIKAGQNVTLIVISENFLAKNAVFEATNFSINAKNIISFQASEIKGMNVKFFNADKLLFDKDSIITNANEYEPIKIDFHAKKINAHGKILAKDGCAFLEVLESINLDDLFVSFGQAYESSVMDEKNHFGLYIDFGEGALELMQGQKGECFGGAGAAYEGANRSYSGSFIADIKRLLTQTSVTISSCVNIQINADIVLTELTDFWFNLRAPCIDISAKITTKNLGISKALFEQEGKSQLIVAPNCLCVDSLMVYNVESMTSALDSPDMNSLYATDSKILLANIGALKKVYNNGSILPVATSMHQDFTLEQYTLENSFDDSDVLLKCALNLYLLNIYMQADDKYITLGKTTNLIIENSEIKIKSIANLLKVSSIRAKLGLVGEIPVGFCLQEYEIQEFFNHLDPFLALAKKLHLVGIANDNALILTNTTYLSLLYSTIRLASSGVLEEVKNTFSRIRNVVNIADDFQLSKYHLNNVCDLFDVLFYRAKSIILENLGSIDREYIFSHTTFNLNDLTIRKSFIFFNDVNAKNFYAYSSRFRGNIKAKDTFTADDCTLELAKHNISVDTEIRLTDSSVILTSDVDLLNFNAKDCNINTQFYSMCFLANPLHSEPFSRSCTFTQGSGALIFGKNPYDLDPDAEIVLPTSSYVIYDNVYYLQDQGDSRYVKQNACVYPLVSY